LLPSSSKIATMARRKKDNTEPDWKGSKAKRLLISELIKGTIPLKNEEMSSRDVYMSYVEFMEFSFDKFQRNLASLWKKIREKKRMAHEENAALKHDLDLYPPKERRSRCASLGWFSGKGGSGGRY
jgi:hypothetical protein